MTATPLSDVSSLAAVIEPILKRYRVRSASLFGSAARGEGGPNSDVDLIVEYHHETTLLDAAGLKLDLEDALGRPVDLVPRERIRPHVRETATRDEVAIL